MKKKRIGPESERWISRQKMLTIMRLLCLFIFGSFMSLHADAFSQQTKVNLQAHQMQLDNLLKELSRQTQIDILFNSDLIKAKGVVDVVIREKEITQVLDELLPGLGLEYEYDQTLILIRERKSVPQVQQVIVEGRVRDEHKNPLPGVTIILKGTSVGAVTDADGNFRLALPESAEIVLLFSSIGYQSLELKVTAFKQPLSVVMKEEVTEVDEVVVTGIYTRKKESFTGSAATYTPADLKLTGARNALEGLKTLDPAFAILDDNEYGSDPNRLPNMEIRGKSSMLGVRDQLEVDPNQPLFILDGFESSISAIMDLDINRIASITILKDAASTAIYGSKAANGVVVVETVVPEAGRLRLNYTGNLNLSMPDLSSYNLMNAKEKLMFDKLAGRFESSSVATDLDYWALYNEKLEAVASGINTYWLAEPLRVGTNQKHSLYVEGGEGNLRFGLGGSFTGNSGVMKKSLRRVVSGNLDLIYRVSQFQFSNKFSVNATHMTNPIVAFQTYAEASPYYKKRNDDGSLEKWLEYNTHFKASNPLWNASLNSRNKGNNLLITNNFIAEYTPSASWKLRARFGITYGNDDTERFYSRDDSRYEERDDTRKGQFFSSDARTNRYEGELTATWAKVLKQHRINLVAGGNIYSNLSLTEGYSVEGFPAGDFSYPSFSNGYPEGGTPTYSETINRSLNLYFNAGYSFDDRYLMDFSLRTSGSSVFGTERKYNTTWSVGLGWNLHREKFIAEHWAWMNLFKIRMSVGNPGNQSFSSAQTLLTYAFQYGSINQFGLGAVLDQIGNPDLEWQTTLDKNIGIDLSLFNRRLSIIADYYHKQTDPLLININMPESSGSGTYLTNAGEQISQGVTLSATYQIIRNTEKRIIWSVRGNLRAQSTELNKIGNKLSALNSNGRGANTVRYYDGSDPDDIWAIQSEGIDPSNGKELFRTPEGDYTYDFSYDHEVKCGNSRPKIEGVLGTQLTWGGLSVNLNFRYQAGADVFNTALFNKVENIGTSQLVYNQDKRALYERWKEPGDIVRFKDIASAVSTPISSRFVQRENIITLESLYVGWEFTEGWITRCSFDNLRIFISMRDVFRASSIRSERGISYPFARTLETGISFNL